MRPTAELHRTLFTLTASVVAGSLAGAIAGWSVASWSVDFSTMVAPTGTAPSLGSPTSTLPEPEITVIPIDRKPAEPILPPAFADRRGSSVAIAYRRSIAKKPSDDLLLTDDRMLGQAVAVTSDGWFVIPRATIVGLHPSDIVIWHNGKAASTTRAVIDRLSGAAFLKTDLANLQAPALSRLHDVSVGLPVWLERRARSFEPLTVLSLADAPASLDGISSETVVRNSVLSGVTHFGDVGAPVWATNGSLVGIVVSSPNDPMRFLPATAWAQSLRSVLANGEAQHALLSVRSVDLSRLRLEAPVTSLPERGAWLRDDRRAKKPAVERGMPAAIAGLKAGDVIQKIDRDILDGSADLSEYLAEYKPDSKVTLTVLRGKETLEIPVTLGSIVTSEEIR